LKSLLSFPIRSFSLRLSPSSLSSLRTSSHSFFSEPEDRRLSPRLGFFPISFTKIKLD
jgi:hypothetical protein